MVTSRLLSTAAQHYNKILSQRIHEMMQRVFGLQQALPSQAVTIAYDGDGNRMIFMNPPKDTYISIAGGSSSLSTTGVDHAASFFKMHIKDANRYICPMTAKPTQVGTSFNHVISQHFKTQPPLHLTALVTDESLRKPTNHLNVNSLEDITYFITPASSHHALDTDKRLENILNNFTRMNPDKFTHFGDYKFFDGWELNSFIDPALIPAIRQNIRSKEKAGKDDKETQRAMRTFIRNMNTAMEILNCDEDYRRIFYHYCITNHIKIGDTQQMVAPGYSQGLIAVNGGTNSMLRMVLCLANHKPLTVLGNCPGVEGTHVPDLLHDHVDNGTAPSQPFDASLFIGLLAHTKKHHPDEVFQDIIKKIGLQPKLSSCDGMTAFFLLACADVYKNLDPSLVNAYVVTQDHIMTYEEAAQKGCAPTFDQPFAGMRISQSGALTDPYKEVRPGLLEKALAKQQFPSKLNK